MTSPAQTYYEVLGVGADAPREEIRDAYRARIEALRRESFKGSADERREQSAAVNRAWNVLSDPFQRERYDESLRTAADATDVEEPSSNGATIPVPAKGGEATREAPKAVVLPSGLQPASSRARVNGLLVDFAVLVLIVFALGQAWSAIASHEAIQVSVGGTVEHTVDVPKGQDTKAFEQQQKTNEVAKQASKTKAGKKPPKVTTKQVKVLSTGAGLVLQLVSLVVALAYVVPASALTGQTLGKRIAKTRLVSADGSPAGWTASLVHYGIPIIVALALQVIGVLLALGMVLWSLRDRNRQGIDDRIARTFVVDAT